MDKEVAKIYETRNYEMFKPLEGNRNDYEQRAQKIIKSINENGYILSPVCINEKNEVIDGQGRLCALRQLNMPVHYYVVRGAGINDCIAMNIYGTRWSTMDYVNSYAERGYQSYVRLTELMGKYPKYSALAIAGVATGILSGGNRRDEIRNGSFELTYEQEINACKVLDYCDRVLPYFKKIPGRKDYLVSAITFLMGVYYKGEFDKERMIESLKTHGTELMPEIATIQTALKGLSNIYNYKKRSSKVYFDVEYDKALRETLIGYDGRYQKKHGSQNNKERT